MNMNFSLQRSNEVLFWLNDRELKELYSGEFWNDEEKEKKKEWYILDGNTDKLVNYLKERRCFEEYESAINFAKSIGAEIKGTGLDIASGVCWATALLSRIETVDKLYAVDISKHRMSKIAPKVFELFNANTKKITRAIGSFYDIKLSENSVDFCFMSQAFHHADNAKKLLSEVYRILKPSGFILIIGETPIYPHNFLKRYIKNIAKLVMPLSKYKSTPVRKLFPTFMDLYPPNKETGDHHYKITDYQSIFESKGFLLHKNKKPHFTNFIAIKQ